MFENARFRTLLLNARLCGGPPAQSGSLRRSSPRGGGAHRTQRASCPRCTSAGDGWPRARARAALSAPRTMRVNQKMLRPLRLTLEVAYLPTRALTQRFRRGVAARADGGHQRIIGVERLPAEAAA